MTTFLRVSPVTANMAPTPGSDIAALEAFFVISMRAKQQRRP